MVFRPSLRSCVAFAGTLTAWLVGSLVVLGLLSDLLQDRTPLRLILQEPLVFLTLVLGMWSLFAATFYLTLRFWTWSVLAHGVRGRSYWGRRVEIRWQEVGKVYATSIEGVPVLGVESRDGKREAMLYLLGVNLAEAHSALLRHAGPDHVLTSAFAPLPPESRRDI